MTQEETFQYWSWYISQDPMVRFGVETRYYLDIICCKNTSTSIVFVKPDGLSGVYLAQEDEISVVNKRWHRLDGPATISYKDNQTYCSYWIEDQNIPYEQFCQEPAVLDYKINKIINEVLSE